MDATILWDDVLDVRRKSVSKWEQKYKWVKRRISGRDCLAGHFRDLSFLQSERVAGAPCRSAILASRTPDG